MWVGFSNVVNTSWLQNVLTIPFSLNVDDYNIWVTKLTYVKSKKTLMVLSEEAVYIINMKTRKQVDIIWNTHDASLTCCAYYPRYSYFISAARDGSIHVHHTGKRCGFMHVISILVIQIQKGAIDYY